MKKIIYLAFLAFGFNAFAQNNDISNILGTNQVLKTAYESELLSLKDKIEVVNEQVAEGNLTEQDAYKVIAVFSEQEEVLEVVEDYNEDWSKESTPFEEAMKIEVDTIVKYRTASSLYLSVGVGNVAVDGAFANSEFAYLRSNTVEWGVAFRKPFSNKSNKWGLRYGLGFRYEGLATTENKAFTLMGNQTVTAVSAHNLRKNYAYLRNTYITIPLTIDFTSSTKSFNMSNRKFISSTGFNFGLGGYVGYNINSKQHIHYTNLEGNRVYEHQKGNWNVNDFQYGLTAYIGTDHLKLVAKYDLNPVFENNMMDQNYWSLGIQIGL